MCIGMTELQKQSFGGVLQLYQKRDSVNFSDFLRTSIFIGHLHWLLLELIKHISTSMELQVFL